MKSRTELTGLFRDSNRRTVWPMGASGVDPGFPNWAASRDQRRLGPGFRLGPLRWVALVAFLVAGSLSSPGATNADVYEYGVVIQKPGSPQWDRDHRLYQELQEQHRKHLVIPEAGTNVPTAAGAFLSFSRNRPDPARPHASATLGNLVKLLFYLALLLAAGVLLLHKWAPHLLADFGPRPYPWAAGLMEGKSPPAKVRAEEDAFGKYLAEFQTGPASAALAEPVEREDSLVEFWPKAREILAAQRKLLASLEQEAEVPARQRILSELHSELSALKTQAEIPGARPIWQVASALGGLVQRLTEKISEFSPSTLRTISGGLDLLKDLCEPGVDLEPLLNRPFKFLLVDDDLVSRKALSLSLKKAFSQPDLAMDGESALALTTQHHYDVIFLDVEMPGMDGFELCTKIRGTGPNRTTPVVFVTSHSDYDARVNSTLSGGNELMGKPFLIFDVAVKALTLALQGRLPGRARPPLPNFAATPAAEDLAVVPRNEWRSLAAVSGVPGPSPAPGLPLDRSPQFSQFLNRASKNLGPLQELCLAILQSSDAEERQTLLAKGFLRISSLLVRTDPKWTHPGYQMSIALEGLFKKLLEDSRHCTFSTLTTLATAVDLLKLLCVPGIRSDLATEPPVRILVVDDDLLARRVIAGALQTVFEKPEGVESGEAALTVLAGKKFDVIFLDVIMPGMSGFDVCARIRDGAMNRATPVVFVTSLDDLATRSKVESNGGSDLMGKPFLPAEITVKALAFALHGRLQRLHPETSAMVP